MPRTSIEVVDWLSIDCWLFRSNSELIYAMLYKRAVFDSLPSHAATLGIGTHLSINLNESINEISGRILDHFGARVTALGANATVPQVLNAIQQGECPEHQGGLFEPHIQALYNGHQISLAKCQMLRFDMLKMKIRTNSSSHMSINW